MKKTFLLFAALCASLVMMAKPAVTIDFSSPENVWNLPADYVRGENTYTYDSLSIVINGIGYVEKGETKGGAKFQSTKNKEGLIMGKRDSYIVLPEFDFAVGSIKVYGIDGAGAKVTYNVFAGETAVSQGATGCDTDHELVIEPEFRAIGTVYTIKITNANNFQTSKIEINEAVVGRPDAPKFSVPAGLYDTVQVVELTCDSVGASILYSFDNESFTTYSEPILISETATLYAKSVLREVESDVVSAAYTIIYTEGDGSKENPYTTDDVALLQSSGKKAWVEGIIIGSTGTGKKGGIVSPAVATNIVIAKDAKDTIGVPVEMKSGSKAREELNVEDHPENVGRKVKIYGTLTSFYSVDGIKSVSDYELVLPEGTPEKPTFSLEEGVYTTPQYVEISCATAGVVITYSLDNITYLDYTEPVLIAQTTTLYAKASKDELTSQSKATYTFVELDGDGSEEYPYSIRDLSLLDNPGDSAWVGGYIIGCGNNNGNLMDSVNDNNVLIADSVTATKGAPIKLSTKGLKEVIGLASNPDNLGKFLKVYGKLAKYLSKPGVTNVSDYQLEGISTMLGTTKDTSERAVKSIKNGQVVIVKDGKCFNLLGTEL